MTALENGSHGDLFSILGAHGGGAMRVMRCFRPGAEAASVVDTGGSVVAELEPQGAAGLFTGTVPGTLEGYRFRFRHGSVEWEEEDSYRFGLILSDLDAYLLAEGRHYRLYEKLGAHPTHMDLSLIHI